MPEELKDMKLPSEKNLKKNVSRSLKKIYNLSSRHRHLTFLGIILIIFIILFFTSEYFWGYLGIEYPEDSRRSYVFNQCVTHDFASCDIDIYKNKAEIDIDLGYFELQGASGDLCDQIEIREDKILLSGCKFANFFNDDKIRVNFRNPSSGIVHSEKLRIINHYEITTFRSFLNFGSKK